MVNLGQPWAFWEIQNGVQGGQDGTDRHLAEHLTKAMPSTSEFLSGQELLLENVVIFTCMVNMFKINEWLLIYFSFFLFFLFRHFLCHIAANSWLASCNYLISFALFHLQVKLMGIREDCFFTLLEVFSNYWSNLNSIVNCATWMIDSLKFSRIVINVYMYFQNCFKTLISNLI